MNATPARTLRRDAAENRKRLLRAAWEVFAEHDGNVGVEDIARRAGVGMGTLYRRFATKDDLITALADELQDEILQEIARIADEQPDGRGLEAVLWSMGEHLAAHHGCLGLVWPVLTSDSNPGRARMWQLIGQLLTQAQRAGEVRGDLTLTDVYLCAASLRALIDETAGPAPSIWRRHLALLLVAFRPSATPLAHRPADDSLVERGLPAAFRDGDQPLRRAGR